MASTAAKDKLIYSPDSYPQSRTELSYSPSSLVAPGVSSVSSPTSQPAADSTPTAAQTSTTDPASPPSTPNNPPSSQPQPPPHRAAQFHSSTLHLSSLHPSPFHQFTTWFTSLPSTSVPETCVLSTAHLPLGRVSSRYVYLKELSPREGFTIYSNWGATSGKGRDFRSNKWVSLVFWWKEVERQVRVEGIGERVRHGEEEGGEAYWRTRERGSRVGAWASRQSEVLRPLESSQSKGEPQPRGEEEGEEEEEEDDGRAALLARVHKIEQRFAGRDGDDIPMPEFWGGLRIRPVMVEFWQGRASRLHDRFRYERRGFEGVGYGGEGEGEGVGYVGEGEGDKGRGGLLERLKADGEGVWRVERLSP